MVLPRCAGCEPFGGLCLVMSVQDLEELRRALEGELRSALTRPEAEAAVASLGAMASVTDAGLWIAGLFGAAVRASLTGRPAVPAVPVPAAVSGARRTV